MRYQIEMTVDYTYDFASDQVRNLVHILPRNIPGTQEVVASLLTIDPVPQERWDAEDFFGNRITGITHLDPVEELSLTLRAQCTRLPREQTLDFSPPLSGLAAELAAEARIDPESPQHFLGSSPRTGPEPEMTAFARGCLAEGMTAMQAVLAIGRALHTEMTFDAGVTDAATPPAEAFARRSGVCQDFTHIMIACLRGIGVPAGYVSGFLRTLPPPGEERLEGADAMHAWVRAWVGSETGWIEYDPTNDLIVATDHITVAIGRDYSDVAPVRGSIRSAGGQESSHAVDVRPVAV